MHYFRGTDYLLKVDVIDDDASSIAENRTHKFICKIRSSYFMLIY